MDAPFTGKYEQLDQLADEFVERYRLGECPPLTEYTDRYPELAEAIRDLFPAMVEMESAVAAGEPVIAPTLRQLGDYRILREIGRGGMGVVYEAEQLSLGRHVALKVLPMQITHAATSVERFRREARSAAKLHHTNIVPVFEVGQDGDACFYAMQFIQGQGLDQVIEELRRLRKSHGGVKEAEPVTERELDDRDQSIAKSILAGRFNSHDVTVGYGTSPLIEPFEVRAEKAGSSSAILPGRTDFSSVHSDRRHFFESVARIGQQVAGALAYAHGRGIVHRDVKPSNLLLDASGIVWVTDFGLAKADDEGLTQTGDLLGTLRYMAPECFQGKGDSRADVYALGLTLYEMLTLRPAFDSPNRAQLLKMAQEDEPLRPRSIDPRIPRDLETIVLKAIVKDPARRYATAQEMCDDLRRFLSGEPIHARRTSLVERCRLWCGRYPALAALYVVLAVTVVSLTFLGLHLHASLKESETSRRQKESAEREAKSRLFDSYLTQAQARRFSRRQGQRFESLTAIREAVKIARELNLPDEKLQQLRNEAISCLALPDLRMVKEWDGWAEGTFAVDFDGALEHYARTDRSGFCFVHRVSDGERIAKLSSAIAAGSYPLMSADGQYVALCHGTGQCRVWHLDRGEPSLILDLQQGYSTAGFDPNGTMFVYGTTDGAIRFLDLPSGRQMRECQVPSDPRWICFNPKQRQICVGCSNSLQIVDIDSAKLVKTQTMSFVVDGLAWHPDGQTLAIVGLDRIIRLFDIPNQRVSRVLSGHNNSGVAAGFNNAGNLLVSKDWSSVLRFWDVRTGQQVFQTPIRAGSGPLRFSRDDRRLAVWTSGSMGLSEIAFGDSYRTLALSSQFAKFHLREPAISPDAQLLAVATGAGVGLFDLRTGAQLNLLQMSSAYHLLFEPSGALLTNGSQTLRRWPVNSDAEGRWKLGPPESLNIVGTTLQLAQSRDGMVLASAQHTGAIVLHRSDGRMVWLGPHSDARHVAVSPDGRWVATGSFSQTGCKIWDANTGELVKELVMNTGGVWVAFSPDGRWLITRAEACQFWHTDSWIAGPRLDRGHPMFSSDGLRMADSPVHGLLRLLDPVDGREIARFEDPNQGDGGMGSETGALSADGSYLVTTNNNTGWIHVWDFQIIRAQLAEMDLDWEAPPFPSRQGPSDANQPLKLEVELGDLKPKSEADRIVAQANAFASAKDHLKALEKLRLALKSDPNHSEAHNNIAWILLTGPEMLRDPKQALFHAKKAAEAPGNTGIFQNTYGVALYRNRQFQEAVLALEKSLRSSKGEWDAFDLFFLAGCHHHLGEATKAEECYDRAVRWVAMSRSALPQGWIEDLASIQKEIDTTRLGK